MEKKRSFLTS
jgi:hypothetical protein